MTGTPPVSDVQAVQDAQARFDELRRRVGLLLGPALFLIVLLLPFDSLTPEGHRLAAVMALVIVFWTTEALPLAVTALLGPALAVMLRVAPVRDALAPFANPLIFLFIGSFILAQALFVHRVNERIAYGVLSWRIIGARPTRILVAYGALAAFLSAWMSNTATTAMLVPIGVSLVVFMESEGKLPKHYGTALMLMTAYGCSIGGMATPVGTPPNIIAIGFIGEQLGVRISFVEWMLVAVPVTVIFMAIVFVYLNWVGRTGVTEIPGAEAIIAERQRALGPWKPGERNAVIAFGVTVLLWIGPGLLPLLLGRDHPFAVAVLSSVPESVAALTGAILLFLLPVSRTERSTLTWKQAAQIDWGHHPAVRRRARARDAVRRHRPRAGRRRGDYRARAVQRRGADHVRGDAVHGAALEHHVEHRRRQHRRADRDLHRRGGRCRPDHAGRCCGPRRVGGGGAAGLHAAERHRLRVRAHPHHQDDQVRLADGRPRHRARTDRDAGGDERGGHGGLIMRGDLRSPVA